VLDFDLVSFIRVCSALALAIWMINTGAAGYAGERLSLLGRVLRLAIAVGLIIQIPEMQYAFIVLAAALLAVHRSPQLAATAMLIRTNETKLEES
jgi:hypothetical protein